MSETLATYFKSLYEANAYVTELQDQLRRMTYRYNQAFKELQEYKKLHQSNNSVDDKEIR